MRSKFKVSMTAFVLMIMLSLVLAACGGDDSNNANNDNASNNSSENNEANTEENEGTNNDGGEELALGQEELTIPYVAWARETISTYMLKNLLEQAGYSVTLRQVEAGPMFSSVAEGSSDLHTSAWLPATHASYWEQYSEDLVQVQEVLDKAPLALTVPSYVEDVNSIEDLIDNEEFGEAVGWEIVGIDPGAGIMANTQTAMEEYGLDNWELITSSEAAMLAQLQDAVANEEPIVVPLWKPHWAFGDMDLKMLEDPKEIYGGEGDQIYTVARTGLEEDAPRAYKVLEQYTESYDMLEEMMPKYYVEEQDVEDVVQDFIDNNPDLVSEWLDGIPTE